MSGKLVKTTFQTGPEDELAAVDVYEGGGGPENTYDDKRGESIDTMEALGENENGEDNSESFESQDSSQEMGMESYASGEMFQRMAAGNSPVNGFLNQLSQAAKDLFKLLPSQSKVSSNNKPIKNNMGMTDLKAVVNIINNLSNSNFDQNIIDTGAQTKLITSAVTTASNSGINGGFQALDKNPNLDRGVLADSALAAIKETITKGNLGVALDVSQTDIMTDVISKEPNVIQTILSAPALTDIPLQDQRTLFKAFTISFEKANPNWNKSTIRNVEMTDLKDLTLSPQMTELLRFDIFELPLTVDVGDEDSLNAAIDVELSTPANAALVTDYRKSVDMLVASEFPIMGVKAALDKEFPYLYIETNSIVNRQGSGIN